MKVLGLAVATVVLLSSPALAASPGKAKAAAKEPASKAEAAAKPEEKLICSREDIPDSHLTKRVCKTQAQIEADRRAAEMLQDRREVMSNRVDMRP